VPAREVQRLVHHPLGAAGGGRPVRLVCLSQGQMNTELGMRSGLSHSRPIRRSHTPRSKSVIDIATPPVPLPKMSSRIPAAFKVPEGSRPSGPDNRCDRTRVSSPGLKVGVSVMSARKCPLRIPLRRLHTGPGVILRERSPFLANDDVGRRHSGTRTIARQVTVAHVTVRIRMIFGRMCSGALPADVKTPKRLPVQG